MLKTRRAVKLLSPEIGQAERFIAEARAAAQLHHRNLIQVHDVGQLPTGAWFMLLDYLDGHTLARLMARRVGPIPPHLIVHLVSEIANGLQVIHQHEIVHRDLRPDTVFLISREGDPHHVVLLDVGVGLVKPGVPAYMSPEQLRGERLSPAADVFSLGIIAYQLSTGGWFPYQYSESRAGYCELPASELLHRQTTRAPVDPRERWPSLRGGWVDAVMAAVDPQIAKRPASAVAFALRLAEALPAIGMSPGGLEIVRMYARELVDGGAGLDTIRMLRPPEVQAAAAPLPANTIETAIGSRYQLGERIGTGGMAEVFAGTMIGVEGFARRVAIKRVLPALSSVPAFAAMFIAEARIASRLAHTNIVSVLDFSRDTEDRLVLVMEYVDGKDLASVLDRGPLPPSLAIFIVVEVLRGLGYVHELPDPPRGTRGLIHRDVSPHNVMLGREGTAKLADFGLARARAMTGSVQTETVRGKPGYMSPEQCAGEALDARSDLYAVGVMLWEMLAHQPLFAGSANEIAAQMLFRGIPSPSSVRSRVPADLEAIALKLLASDRRDRYPSAHAAIEALLGCVDAPRDGRGELAQLLAERLSGPPSGTGGSPSSPSGQPNGLPVRQITAPDLDDDAEDAACEVARAPTGGGRRRYVAVIALAAAGAAVSGLRGGPDEPRVMSIGAERRVQLPVAASPVERVAPAAAPTVAPAVRVEARAVLPGEASASGRHAPVLPPSEPSLASLVPPSLVSPRFDVDRGARMGELAIIVRPWALIWLNGKPVGQTPFRALVPVGRYRVRLANDDVGQSETAVITVAADRTTTVERSW